MTVPKHTNMFYVIKHLFKFKLIKSLNLKIDSVFTLNQIIRDPDFPFDNLSSTAVKTKNNYFQ